MQIKVGEIKAGEEKVERGRVSTFGRGAILGNGLYIQLNQNIILEFQKKEKIIFERAPFFDIGF